MTPEQRTASIRERRQPKRASNGQEASHKIWIRENWEYLPVYEVPIDVLVLNVDNHRFGAERDMVETKLGRPLDPANNPLDDESVVAILCDSSLDVDVDAGKAIGTPSKDFLALKDDWSSRHQAEPLWIRPDGTVRNGNRRLAMLKRLREEGTDVNWVDAIILDPREIDEAELFRMEQREQLTENFKKRYQDINALLALKAAADLEGIDWDDPASLNAIAIRLKHYAGRDDAAYALTQLQAIRAIEAYLTHIGVPGRYSLASRQVEVFREVGKCMAAFEDEPEDGYELVQAAFSFVQANRTYQELRTLRRMFVNDRDRFREFASRILSAETDAGWRDEDPSGDVESPELNALTAPEDEEDPPEAGNVSSAGYPKAAVKPVIDAGLDEFAAQSMDVSTQLTQALTRLRAVSAERLAETLVGDDAASVRTLLAEIDAWVQSAKALGE